MSGLKKKDKGKFCATELEMFVEENILQILNHKLLYKLPLTNGKKRQFRNAVTAVLHKLTACRMTFSSYFVKSSLPH